MPAMEGLELVIGELGDDGGVATAVHRVGVVGEQGVLCDAVVGRVRRGVDPLHLVEHHTLICHILLRCS